MRQEEHVIRFMVFDEQYIVYARSDKLYVIIETYTYFIITHQNSVEKNQKQLVMSGLRKMAQRRST